MSGRRVAVLLIAAIALVIGAIWLASQRRLERARLPGDLVLPGLEHHVSEVTQLSLAKGNGTRTTLKKDASGWNVAERSWPADLSPCTGTVRSICGIRTTGSPARSKTG